MVKCSVKCCFRHANTDMGISFFRFPAESARCDEWLRALGRPDLEGVNAEKLHISKYRVCGVHFHPTSFSSMLMNRLKKDAVPVSFPTAANPGPFFDGDLNELDKNSPENNTNIDDKVDCANNFESHDINAVEGETRTGSENEDSRNSDKQSILENEEQVESEKERGVDVNETTEDSITQSTRGDETENSKDDKVENTKNDETENTQSNETKNSQNDETEKSKNDVTENTPDDKTEKSQNIENGKSQDEEIKNPQEDQKEKSKDEETRKVENGVLGDIANDEVKDTDRKMETDENEEDDDDDFNPLLLCPDISMDVEESPVLTGTTDSSQVNDAADSNSLFAPLFSTFVDEMTGAEISFNLTAEEQQLREKLYGPNNPIQFSKIHCTACNVHLGSALAGQTNRFVHPLLKVLICKECYHFYTSGEFEKDEDGSELYCRWCGQGGQVLCCTMCEFVFCKKCIRINFGRKKLTQVRDSDEWKCFRCDMSQLKALRAMCVEFFEYIRRETARAATYSDSDIVNKDLTNCCQSQSRKRQLDYSDKETEKEVVKRPKRRKNEEEDPDYNPFAQQSEDRPDSPVPSTSGVKSVASVTKAVMVHPKATAARTEVSFPGQSPSSTVRIGNQVINVKSVATPSQKPNTASPTVKGTASATVKNTAIRTPIASTNIRAKPTFTPRSAVQTSNVRPAIAVPAVGSIAHIRAAATSSKSQNAPPPVMKHEWFEKTVRAAARVNSNLSYTLTQLNKAQSSASSVEQLAVVHNKLQEILSSSINSLIQIRKNLRTEFIAGIKTIRFPPKPTVDPNDDDVIIINPEPKTTPNTTRNNKASVPVPALVAMKKTTTPVTQNRVSNNTPNKGYLKVRSFSQLQSVSSECITIPDDDPPPPLTNTEPVIVDIVDEPVSEKDPIGSVSKENDGNKAEDASPVQDKGEKSVSEVSENVASEVSENLASEGNIDNESTKTGGDNDIQEETQKEKSKKESEKDKNEECIQNGEKERKTKTEKRKRDDDEISISENKSNGADSNDSQKCNGNLTDVEVVVKKEPNENSYNVKDQPTPKIRRMLSVKVNLKKTPIVENMVKQEPLENGGN